MAEQQRKSREEFCAEHGCTKNRPPVAAIHVRDSANGVGRWGDCPVDEPVDHGHISLLPDGAWLRSYDEPYRGEDFYYAPSEYHVRVKYQIDYLESLRWKLNQEFMQLQRLYHSRLNQTGQRLGQAEKRLIRTMKLEGEKIKQEIADKLAQFAPQVNGHADALSQQHRMQKEQELAEARAELTELFGTPLTEEEKTVYFTHDQARLASQLSGKAVEFIDEQRAILVPKPKEGGSK